MTQSSFSTITSVKALFARFAATRKRCQCQNSLSTQLKGGGERPLRVLIASGHGYGNLGDEAQLSACIGRWRRLDPNVEIRVLSPDPEYTRLLHNVATDWAPRVAWFESNTRSYYFSGGWKFQLRFASMYIRLTLSARLAKIGIPFLLCRSEEARIIELLRDYDLLQISGGGFLTGMTRSRLWENCLVMRLCQLLGLPYFLTGHTIGVFKSPIDRILAKIGLRDARFISLRDRGASQSELEAIGIAGPHIVTTNDDALFCDRLDDHKISERLAELSLPKGGYIAVNYHNWGQTEERKQVVETIFIDLCRRLVHDHGEPLLFIYMAPSDIASGKRVLSALGQQTAEELPFHHDYRLVRGIIAAAKCVLTFKHHPIIFAQGESVPVIAIALDDYYIRKNFGALAHVGQQHFLIDSETYFSDTLYKRVVELISQTTQPNPVLAMWLAERKREILAPYRRMRDEITHPRRSGEREGMLQ